MYLKDNRYIFNGCQVNSGVNPAIKCSCSNIEFVKSPNKSDYARLFIETQEYENCTCPECALKNGTFFNALYMPYRFENECCTSVMDAKCLRNKNLISNTKCSNKGGNRNVRMS